MRQKKSWKKSSMALTMSVIMALSGLSVPAAATATDSAAEVTAAKTAKVTLKKKATVYVGVKQQLKATVTPAGTKATLKWKSSNKKVVKVNQKGVAAGVKAGKATIKLTAKVGKKTITKSCKVTVKKPVLIKSISLTTKKSTLAVGETTTVAPKIKPAKASVKTLTYTSSNDNIAVVSAKGVITAKAPGTVQITGKAIDGSKKKAAVTITVTGKASESKKAESITASVKTSELIAGDEAKITVAPQPEGAVLPTLEYTSSDHYAATVSSDGTIKALAQGSTVITVKSADGALSAEVPVNVDYDRKKVDKPRVIITNDGEIDDKNSYVHLLYYANEIDLVGLIQTSSFAHWAGTDNPNVDDKYKVSYAWPGIDWQDEMIDDYAELYPNLRVHDANYPTPNYLHSVVKIGNIGYTGDMDEATEGSEHIKSLILDDVEGPLYITAWGGLNTVGRALRDIYEEYGNTVEWNNIRQKIYDKVRIYMWYGQDGKDAEGYDPVYDNVVALYYPELTVLDVKSCQAVGWSWDKANTNNKHQIPEVMSGNWLYKNIDSGHGDLLEKWYVTWGDGTHVVDETDYFQLGEKDELMNSHFASGRGRSRYDFCGEGDTPTYLPFFDMGLDSLENYEWGSIAGRFEKVEGKVNKNGEAITNYYVPVNDYVKMSDWADVGEETEYDSYDSGARWVTDIMDAFAARADWGIKSGYEKANHRPNVTIKEGKAITASAGDRVYLNAKATDPDGDSVSLQWFNYIEAGTYRSSEDADEAKPSSIAITGGGKGARMSFVVPSDAKSGDTIHMLVKATDDGEHNLSYYQRVVITVK